MTTMGEWELGLWAVAALLAACFPRRELEPPAGPDWHQTTESVRPARADVLRLVRGFPRARAAPF